MQNTVQVFLRTMEQKNLVVYRTEGRTFVYRPVQPRERTTKTMLSSLLATAFDGAIDQLVASALAVKRPSAEELDKLRALLAEAERKKGKA